MSKLNINLVREEASDVAHIAYEVNALIVAYGRTEHEIDLIKKSKTLDRSELFVSLTSSQLLSRIYFSKEEISDAFIDAVIDILEKRANDLKIQLEKFKE